MTIYFGPLFYVPVEVLGHRTAGLVTGVGNLFANLGALSAAYLLGLIKDFTGSFTWGFFGIAGLCCVGVLLSFVLAGLRRRALATAYEGRGSASAPALATVAPKG
jgi:sugar phosphate permease